MNRQSVFRQIAKNLLKVVIGVPSGLSRLNRLSSKYGSRVGERGQVVVEYVLLLVASVTLALIITRLMVGRDPGNPGFVLSAWNSIVEEIGADHADDIRQ